MADAKQLNVYGRLQQARVELQNKKLKKSGKNSFSHYDYFVLDDFLPSLNEIFLKVGLSDVFNLYRVITETGMVEERATLRIINVDNPSEEIVYESPVDDSSLKGATPIQSLGAKLSYMRRYLYLSALQISESADALDNVNGEKGKEPVKKHTPMTPYQKRVVNFMEDKYKFGAMKKFNVDDVNELSSEQASQIIAGLEKANALPKDEEMYVNTETEIVING